MRAAAAYVLLLAHLIQVRVRFIYPDRESSSVSGSYGHVACRLCGNGSDGARVPSPSEGYTRRSLHGRRCAPEEVVEVGEIIFQRSGRAGISVEPCLLNRSAKSN